LTVFAIVWATATLVHLLSFHFWAMSWQGWVLILCVAQVLMRPNSLIRFVAMVTASLANLYYALPFVPNHILFEGMINVTILLGVGGSVLKHRRELAVAWSETANKRSVAITTLVVAIYFTALMLSTSYHLSAAFTVPMIVFLGRRTSEMRIPQEVKNAVYEDFATVLRIELAVMYFWAVIQKLNWDYFNPAVSCAAKLQRELEAVLHLPTSPDWMLPLSIWGSLLLEGTIPILLLCRRTRRIGFIVALAFHFWLSLHPHPGIYSFSALVFGMLVLFLPRAQLEELFIRWSRQRETALRKLRLPKNGPSLGAATIILFYVVGVPSAKLYEILGQSLETFRIVNLFGLIWFLIWGVWLGISYMSTWRTSSSLGANIRYFCRTPAWLGLLVVLFNGTNPWIGLKTQNSFAMFSNLRSEFDCNHMFLRRIDLFTYQKDMLEIRHSEPDLLSPTTKPKTIEKFANPGGIMPFFELRRLLSRTTGDVRVVVFRDGKTEVIERKGETVSHPDAFTPPSLLEYKALWFRRLNNWHGPMPCTH